MLFKNSQLTMFAIQIFLPLRSNSGVQFSKNYFDEVSQNLIDRFGGVTAYLRAPASGSWQDDNGKVVHDEIVVYEVLADSIDEAWWKDYRLHLESNFRQEKVVIRAQEISVL